MKIMKENFKLAQEFLKESGILGFSEEFSCLNLRPIKKANEEWQRLLQLEKQDLVLRVLEEVLNSSKLVNIRRALQIHGELFELNKFEIVLISPYYYRYYVEYSNFFRKLAYAHLELRFQKFKNLI